MSNAADPFDSLSLQLQMQAGEILARKAAEHAFADFARDGRSLRPVRMGGFLAEMCREYALGQIRAGHIGAEFAPEMLLICTYAASTRVGLMEDPCKMASKVRAALYDGVAPLVGGHDRLHAGLDAYSNAFVHEDLQLAVRVAAHHSGTFDEEAIGAAAPIVMYVMLSFTWVMETIARASVIKC